MSKIVASLPPVALPESSIEELTNHEKIGDWASVMAYYNPEIGEELIFNFIIEISALVNR